MKIEELILAEAYGDVGMQEKKGNSGWKDPQFDLEMRTTGWSLGQAWCAYWTEKVWCAAYEKHNPQLVPLLRKLFSANAAHTYEQFSSSIFTTSLDPVPGAVVIWRKKRDGEFDYVGDTTWIRGHAGLVTSVGDDDFATLEGNSNQSGGREGIEVASLTRYPTYDVENGLELAGFIHPLSEVV
tara:strand:- start:216 stop:764 length:549 start_codon:yes stop_codon:yes gene_type:complete